MLRGKKYENDVYVFWRRVRVVNFVVICLLAKMDMLKDRKVKKYTKVRNEKLSVVEVYIEIYRKKGQGIKKVDPP
jgi:hypothetical protein